MLSEILILPMLLLHPATGFTVLPSDQQVASVQQQQASARAAVVVIYNQDKAKSQGNQVRRLGKLKQPQYKK